MSLDLLDFSLDARHEAGEPPEMRGLARDEVRLMVSHYTDDRVSHLRFNQLPDVLQPGDLLVINTSGTLKAALPATRDDGMAFELHLSTRLPADLWIVEIRLPDGHTSLPFHQACAGDGFALPGEGRVTLLAPYDRTGRAVTGPQCGGRLWIASLGLPMPWGPYLEQHGFPIRYSYAKEAWPADYYQTVYATEPGSAELPSAGRAFTPSLLTRLIAHGIQVAPLLLHTGVSSVEDHEPPYEEYYKVPAETVALVNAAKRAGRRVVAVGTTVVRALETVIDAQGTLHPGEGWTRLLITPERGIRSVDGILTGLHEPRATHLAMLEALCGRGHLKKTYGEAVENDYLWHEFGDLHLIVP